MGSVSETSRLNAKTVELNYAQSMMQQLDDAKNNLTSQSSGQQSQLGQAQGQNYLSDTSMGNMLAGFGGTTGSPAQFNMAGGATTGCTNSALNNIAQQLASGALQDETAIQNAKQTVETIQKSLANEVNSIKEGIDAAQKRETVKYA